MRNILLQTLIGLILGFGLAIAIIAWTENTPASAIIVGGITVFAAIATRLWLAPPKRRPGSFRPQGRWRG